MKGSGLEDLLGDVYAENSIPHILSGKAIARSLRACMSVQSALMTLMIQNIKEEHPDLSELAEIEKFHSSILDGIHNDNTFEKLTTSHGFQKVTKMVQDLKTKLASQSRTSKLWLLYIDYVDVVKMFIFAERTSDWELHLLAVTKMLNLLAATGHIHYAKSARLYVQEMRKLPQTHPWLYQQFMEEQHTVKRTEKNFNGLCKDLAIEQTFMRSIKSRGGLTEGRGMTESVRHLWVLSLNYMASIHEAMMQLSKAQIVSKHHAVVVFDGYDDESTKSHEHLHQNSVSQSKFVKIFTNNLVPYTQDRYLSCIQNKAEFIKFISNLLMETNIEVHNYPGDADSFIVEKSLEHASLRKGRPVSVVADDTDIAIMLLHHWKPDDHDDIYFVQERYNKAWSIKEANPCKCLFDLLLSEMV